MATQARNLSGFCPVKDCKNRSDEYSKDKGYCKAHSLASAVLYTHKVKWDVRYNRLTPAQKSVFHKVVPAKLFNPIAELDFMVTAEMPASSGLAESDQIDQALKNLLARNPARLTQILQGAARVLPKNVKPPKGLKVK